MLNLLWSDKALADLDRIVDYIDERSPAGARRIQALVEAAAERACQFPHLYRAGRVSGTREAAVHPNYILVYEVRADMIVVIAVLHARQNYP